jgi:hypothetical protein
VQWLQKLAQPRQIGNFPDPVDSVILVGFHTPYLDTLQLTSSADIR